MRVGRIRRGSKGPPLQTQDVRRFCLEIADSRTELTDAPRLPPFPNGQLPTRNMVHTAIPDKEFNQVLEARSESLTAYREMNRRQVVGTPDPIGIDRIGHGQQVSERTSLCVHLPVTHRVDAHVGLILHAKERRTVEG